MLGRCCQGWKAMELLCISFSLVGEVTFHHLVPGYASARWYYIRWLLWIFSIYAAHEKDNHADGRMVPQRLADGHAVAKVVKNLQQTFAKPRGHALTSRVPERWLEESPEFHEGVPNESCQDATISFVVNLDARVGLVWKVLACLKPSSAVSFLYLVEKNRCWHTVVCQNGEGKQVAAERCFSQCHHICLAAELPRRKQAFKWRVWLLKSALLGGEKQGKKALWCFQSLLNPRFLETISSKKETIQVLSMCWVASLPPKCFSTLQFPFLDNHLNWRCLWENMFEFYLVSFCLWEL